MVEVAERVATSQKEVFVCVINVGEKEKKGKLVKNEWDRSPTLYFPILDW